MENFFSKSEEKNCVSNFSHMRNSIHNISSGVKMYQQIHHQGSRCINEYIARGGVVLENASSSLRNITKYIHFCLFNKVNVISKYNMELRDVLKIHGKLRRYCTSSVKRSETREVQYLLSAPCIFNTSRDSMWYLYYLFI